MSLVQLHLFIRTRLGQIRNSFELEHSAQSGAAKVDNGDCPGKISVAGRAENGDILNIDNPPRCPSKFKTAIDG
jgi:hypothetical protein